MALSANVKFPVYGIMESALRLAHFMAQLCHESGSFRYMEEIASGAAYEGREDLGNVYAGDGQRYKGRDPIQLTGRANYRTFGRRIGIDLERHPEIAAVPSIGLHTALEYSDDRSLNAWADRGTKTSTSDPGVGTVLPAKLRLTSVSSIVDDGFRRCGENVFVQSDGPWAVSISHRHPH